jgi:hypothetical protein
MPRFLLDPMIPSIPHQSDEAPSQFDVLPLDDSPPHSPSQFDYCDPQFDDSLLQFNDSPPQLMILHLNAVILPIDDAAPQSSKVQQWSMGSEYGRAN